MPTSKKRLNMSLPEDVRAALAALAKRDDVTPTTKALHLIMMALEIEEDDVWNAIAEKRDTKDADFASHEDAWA
jgi:cell wall assembly regulator SMI1